MLADPQVVRYLSGKTSTREDAWRNMAAMLGHEQLRGFSNNAVVDKATGRFLGRCGLWNPEGWPGTEVGWALASEAWGNGYATEAAAAWRDWAFAELPIDELISVIHVDNARSKAVARRIGHRYMHDLDVRGSPCEIWGQPRSGLEA